MAAAPEGPTPYLQSAGWHCLNSDPEKIKGSVCQGADGEQGQRPPEQAPGAQTLLFFWRRVDWHALRFKT